MPVFEPETAFADKALATCSGSCCFGVCHGISCTDVLCRHVCFGQSSTSSTGSRRAHSRLRSVRLRSWIFIVCTSCAIAYHESFRDVESADSSVSECFRVSSASASLGVSSAFSLYIAGTRHVPASSSLTSSALSSFGRRRASTWGTCAARSTRHVHGAIRSRPAYLCTCTSSGAVPA